MSYNEKNKVWRGFKGILNFTIMTILQAFDVAFGEISFIIIESFHNDLLATKQAQPLPVAT